MTLYNNELNLVGFEVVDVKTTETGAVCGLMLHKSGVYIELDVN